MLVVSLYLDLVWGGASRALMLACELLWVLLSPPPPHLRSAGVPNECYYVWICVDAGAQTRLLVLA